LGTGIGVLLRINESCAPEAGTVTGYASNGASGPQPHARVLISSGEIGQRADARQDFRCCRMKAVEIEARLPLRSPDRRDRLGNNGLLQCDCAGPGIICTIAGDIIVTETKHLTTIGGLPPRPISCDI
jgi:hypothetical protein